MKKLIYEKEIISYNRAMDDYDIAVVVKVFEVTQYCVVVEDYDSHDSDSIAYDSKRKAEAAKNRYKAFSSKMGTNKDFYIRRNWIRVKRYFNIDMNKRDARERLRDSYTRFPRSQSPFLNRVAEHLGFAKKGYTLHATGIYYPAKAKGKGGVRVYFYFNPGIEGKHDGDDYLLFKSSEGFEKTVLFDKFKLKGGHIRWSSKSDYFPDLED